MRTGGRTWENDGTTTYIWSINGCRNTQNLRGNRKKNTTEIMQTSKTDNKRKSMVMNKHDHAQTTPPPSNIRKLYQRHNNPGNQRTQRKEGVKDEEQKERPWWWGWGWRWMEEEAEEATAVTETRDIGIQQPHDMSVGELHRQPSKLHHPAAPNSGTQKISKNPSHCSTWE